MGLYKRAHIRGMVHEMGRRGFVAFPSKLAEEEAADAIADALPEEVVPEETDEEGLTPEQAQEAMEQIIEVAEELAQKTGGHRQEDTCKIASSMTHEDAASGAAIALMQKAAEETAVATGPDIPGSTPPTPDLGATAEGEVDAATVPSAEIVVPQGTTEVDTSPGAVGKAETRPDQPGAQGSSPTGEPAKTANVVERLESLLSQLSNTGIGKQAAMDGASLSGGAAGGPAPTPRVDLDDNLDIPGAVASGQGQTAQDVPAAANVGVTKKQPAGTPGVTAPTPNNVAQDAVKKAMDTLKESEQGRQLLAKISEEMKDDEEKKKEKKKEDDEECSEDSKEAKLASALQNLATVLKAD